MQLNFKRGLGIGFLFIGLFITFTGKVLTGSVIGTKPENYLGLFGVLIFFIGLALILESWKKEETLSTIVEDEAQKLLGKRKVLTKPKRLVSLAKRMGYALDSGGKHQTKVYQGKRLVTIIPWHSSINRYTAQGIMKKLSESYRPAA